MITPPIIKHANGSFKKVKNLGWLLRNWQQVKEFRVYTRNLLNSSDDAYIVAELYNGNKYETGFADKMVLFRFLKRSIFYDLHCIVDGINNKISKHGIY